MIVNVNKPKNWTSFDVVSKYRGITGIKKVGHSGTLDPLATGVLLLLTGKDRKNQNEIMRLPKEYIAEVTFGASSATYDLELTPEPATTIPTLTKVKSELPKIVTKYTGKIEQTVPAYSAKKVKGQPLYKKARKGTLDLSSLPTKEVEIFEIELLDFYERSLETTTGTMELPAVKCRISCSTGTYIRSLAHDWGVDLDCAGILTELVRTRVGDHVLQASTTLEEIESAAASSSVPA